MKTIKTTNRRLLEKQARLTTRTGMSEEEVIDQALDLFEAHVLTSFKPESFEALFKQMDRLPDLPRPQVPLTWDQAGLPV